MQLTKIEKSLLKGEILLHRKTTKSNKHKALKKVMENMEKFTKHKSTIEEEIEFSEDEDLSFYDESEEGTYTKLYYF